LETFRVNNFSKHFWNDSKKIWMLGNNLNCFQTYLKCFKHSKHSKVFRNIYWELFLELSCNQFFKTLEIIPNKSEHFWTLWNIPIFWTVSKQISGTFHVNNFQEYFEMFPTNHNVSKHSKIFTNKSAIYSKKYKTFWSV